MDFSHCARNLAGHINRTKNRDVAGKGISCGFCSFIQLKRPNVRQGMQKLPPRAKPQRGCELTDLTITAGDARGAGTDVAGSVRDARARVTDASQRGAHCKHAHRMMRQYCFTMTRQY